MYVCMYACMYVCMYVVCMYVCLCVCMRACVHVCMCTLVKKNTLGQLLQLTLITNNDQSITKI